MELDKKYSNNPFKIPLSEKQPKIEASTHQSKESLIAERRHKDIHFEAYEDLHYIIKNIASRLSTTSAQKITFAQLACDLLESELKRRFKGEYKEFSELYKKLK